MAPLEEAPVGSLNIGYLFKIFLVDPPTPINGSLLWEDEMEAEEEMTKSRGRKRRSSGSTKISHFFKATVSPSRTVQHRQPFFVAVGLSPVESL
ncbi:hypothetical protein TSMEX_009509 [Taenia solium]|eukprot:TsM_000795100 transcript=TsM_000795100 gene=TsM_000795100